MSGSSAPPAPNYGPILQQQADQAKRANDLAAQQQLWAQQQYAASKPAMDKITANDIAAQQSALEFAQKQKDQYDRVYRPQLDALSAEANSYASPEREQLEAGRDEAAVSQQFDSARNASIQNLESYGINPSATRFAGLDIGVRTAEAASVAGAGNQAIQRVAATRRALQAEVLNYGQAFPGQFAGAINTGVGAGASGANVTDAATMTGANTMGTGMGFMGQANGMINAQGNTLNMGFSNQLSSWKAQQQADNAMWGGIGKGIGFGADLLFASHGGLVNTDGESVVHPHQVEPSNAHPMHPANSNSYTLHDGVHHVVVPAHAHDGRLMSAPEAQDTYLKTGTHLGKFATKQGAVEHAQLFHHTQRMCAGGMARYADGGAIPGNPAGNPAGNPQQGGAIPAEVSPSGGKNVDDVPARVNVGEFIMPKPVVDWFGQKHMYSMIEKAKKDKAEIQQKTGAIPQFGPAKAPPRQALAVG